MRSRPRSPSTNPTTRPANGDLPILRAWWLSVAAAVVILVAGGTLVTITAAPLGEGRLAQLIRSARGLFDVDQEANLWAWYSTILLAALALTLAVTGVTRRASGDRNRGYFVMAAVALYMSADEAATLHEQLRFFVPSSFSGFQWLWVGIPLALVVGIVLLAVSRDLKPVHRKGLVIAGAVFLAGAIGMELLAADYVLSAPPGVDRYASPRYLIGVLTEEGLEAAGVLIALRVLLSTLRIRRDDGTLRIDQS